MKQKSVIAVILCLTLLLSGCSGLLEKFGGDKWQEQYDLGMRYLEEGDYEEAILAFNAAIEIDDSRPEAYMGRAEAYIAVNEPEKALKDYKKARRLAKNDDAFEDLVEDLEELIEHLEEVIEEHETEPENTTEGWELEDDWHDSDEFRITVTDAFVETSSDPYFDSYPYCYHIPRINLQDDLAEGVNSQIYDTLYAAIEDKVYDYVDHYGYPACGSIFYSWNMRDGIVSVVVEENWAEWYWTNYYVYNVSAETGELVSNEELWAVYGLDRDGFYATARAVLESQFDAYSAETIEMVGQESFDYIVSMTLSEENLSQAMPFIGPDGSLCMAAMQYGIAGASYYWHVYNLESGELYAMPECGGDHTADSAVYTAEEITQMVADWFDWNVGGYESGTHVAFFEETTVSEGKCFVVVRFQNSDPNYTGGANVLVTVAEVDMATGEMWSDGYFRGYLW